MTDRDDRNDRPVPYDFIRPGGRGGNCFALAYRAGADYLLFLRHSERPSDGQPNELTPVLGASKPTNEQLIGGTTDAWFVWVSKELKRRPAAIGVPPAGDSNLITPAHAPRLTGSH